MGGDSDICVEIVDTRIEKHISTMIKMRGESLNNLHFKEEDATMFVCGDLRSLELFKSILEKDVTYSNRKFVLLKKQLDKTIEVLSKFSS